MGINITKPSATNYNFYMCGVANRGAGPVKACYWANEILHDLDLPLGTVSSVANAIHVIENIAFVAGSYNNGTKEVACYWESSTSSFRHDLTNGTTIDGYAKGIYIYKNHVYVCGWTTEDRINNIPCYWEDGVKVDLDVQEFNGVRNAEAYKIFVKDDVVYTSGLIFYGANTYSCFWRDTSRTNLPGGGN